METSTGHAVLAEWLVLWTSHASDLENVLCKHSGIIGIRNLELKDPERSSNSASMSYQVLIWVTQILALPSCAYLDTNTHFLGFTRSKDLWVKTGIIQTVAHNPFSQIYPNKPSFLPTSQVKWQIRTLVNQMVAQPLLALYLVLGMHQVACHPGSLALLPHHQGGGLHYNSCQRLPSQIGLLISVSYRPVTAWPTWHQVCLASALSVHLI